MPNVICSAALATEVVKLPVQYLVSNVSQFLRRSPLQTHADSQRLPSIYINVGFTAELPAGFSVIKRAFLLKEGSEMCVFIFNWLVIRWLWLWTPLHVAFGSNLRSNQLTLGLISAVAFKICNTNSWRKVNIISPCLTLSSFSEG